MSDSGARLTPAQSAVAGVISEVWGKLAEPAVVVLDAPGGRGKTRIVQEFYDGLAGRQPQSRRFWRGRLAGDALPGWRERRKRVAPESVDITQAPGWLWLGLEGYPLGRVDFAGQLRLVNDAIVAGFAEGRLPAGAADALRRGAARDVLPGLVKAAKDVLADLAGAGLVKTGLEAALAVRQGITARDDFGVQLSVSDPAAMARAVLATMFVTGVLGGSETALAPAVIAVDDAHLLDPSAVAALDALVHADPEAELLGSGFLSGPPRAHAAARGLPAAAPLLILATAQPLGPSEPDHFGAQVETWRQQGIDVVAADQDLLRLLDGDAAAAVAARLLARHALGEEQLRMIAERAADRVLGGVNASLLIAHCEQVDRLTDPRSTVDDNWAEQHLPRFVEEEARRRFDALPATARAAVTAGSLRGPAFAFEAASIMLPALGDDTAWVDEVQQSGFALRSGDAEQFVFVDEPSYAYARAQAMRDTRLCTKALTEVSGPLLRRLWAKATVGPLGGGRTLYELSRQEAFQYRELVTEAGLRGRAVDPEVWFATLGFASEVQFARESSEPSGPRDMLALWEELTTGQEPLPGDGWAIAARWVVHRHVPGSMTFANAWAGPPEMTRGWTRLDRQAPGIAARVAARTLPSLLADGRPLYEPGLRLLLRLGITGRLLPAELRRLVATRLLFVAPLRLSAAVLLARVYRTDLSAEQRARLLQVLLGGPAEDSDNAAFRRSLALAWTGDELPPEVAATVVDDLVSPVREPFGLTGFGVAGRVADAADPFVYPWAQLQISAAVALLTSKVLPVRDEARQIAARRLFDAVETHPGVAALIASGRFHDDAGQRDRARAAVTRWRELGALECGRFDLSGPAAPPRAKKRKR
ncbi:hypothetical protein ACQPZX_27740 [Actinoplanes sp. CA-142083]|uniref:hypothetical protein n=1 Tax=Actinoplanes sp. CA-142083 TaxID=3239903 RepID=UPI003D8B0307